MPYKPVRNGSIYNQKLADLHGTNRQIRKLIELITEGDINHTKLYQCLTAITLATVRSDDLIRDLQNFDE